MKQFLKSGIACGLTFLPVLALAQGGQPIVPCGTGETMCTFADFAVLGNRVVDFLLIDVLVPLATISIAVAGFRYLFAFGNQSTITQVHGMFKYTVGGVVLALAAYLIVKAVLGVLVEPDFNPFL